MKLSGSPHKAPIIISVAKTESAVSQIHSTGVVQLSAVSLVAESAHLPLPGGASDTPGGRCAMPGRTSATHRARSGLSSRERRLG